MLEKLTREIQSSGTPDKPKPELISYRQLRRAIGWLGILLPVVLIIGGYLLGNCRQVQPSISHYYYTNMREVFVGTLCSVALFLFCYKGHNNLDSRSANIAGFLGLMVALFPTNVIGSPGSYYACQQDIVSFTSIPFHNTIHLVSAACFFLTLAFMSIFLFTKSDEPPANRTPEKITRNRIYRVCGVIMVLCIAFIGSSFFLFKSEKENQITLIGEAVALLAFGVSWLTKGEVIAAD